MICGVITKILHKTIETIKTIDSFATATAITNIAGVSADPLAYQCGQGNIQVMPTCPPVSHNKYNILSKN